LQSFNKILIIRLSSLGDIILTFPLLKKLRQKYPDSKIHFLTKSRFAELVSLNPNVDRIIQMDDSLKNTRKEVKKENYDLIIDIHKNFRSIFLSSFNAKKVLRYSKENFKKFLLVKLKINLFKEVIPVYKKYLLTLKTLLSSDTDYQFTISDLKFVKKRIYEEKYVVVAPASRHFTKTYPAEKFIEFINKNSKERFVLVGDDTEGENNICSDIESKCENVINKCGKLNMTELANIIYNSEYVICNDSAILHLSEALGKRVVAIFGSTVKEFGFFPQLKESKVLEVKGLKCRPCTHIGRDSCPEGHFKCMGFQLTVSSSS
jgi:heptosyltransferase-2